MDFLEQVPGRKCQGKPEENSETCTHTDMFPWFPLQIFGNAQRLFTHKKTKQGRTITSSRSQGETSKMANVLVLC